MEFVTLLGIVGSFVAGWYLLRVRDLVRWGHLHRRAEELRSAGLPYPLPEGRVPCPECAEAILPQARRCPYCRQAVAQRDEVAVRDLAPPA
jgi:hypothetical protein